MKRLSLSLLLIFILTACAETGESLTLEANYTFAGTQVAELRLTATVQGARARTTLDFMGTRAARAATQSTFFEQTLVATGFSPNMLATRREQALGSSPTPLPTFTPLAENTDDVELAASEMPAETFTPTPPAVTLNAPAQGITATPLPNSQPTPDLGGLTIGNVLTATAPGNNGCGAGVTSTFNTSTPEIYVIIPAFNITANDYTFAARWQKDGQPIGPVYDFAPSENIDEICIWLFVDQTDFLFEAGNYSVFVDINGQQAAGPIPFVIQ